MTGENGMRTVAIVATIIFVLGAAVAMYAMLSNWLYAYEGQGYLAAEVAREFSGCHVDGFDAVGDPGVSHACYDLQ